MVGYLFRRNVPPPSSGVWGCELTHNRNPEDSAVTRLWAGSWRNCHVFRSMAKRYTSFHNDPDWLWCPSDYCTMGTGWWYGQGVKLTTLFYAEVKNEWLDISILLYVFMACTGAALPCHLLFLFTYMVINMWQVNTNSSETGAILEKALLALRILRKLTVHGFKKPHESADALHFLNLVFDRAKTMLECSK